ncbi:MAG: ABC transporter permease, partial [Chloroflexota bacterium]|nr:ABC transporter permease [Chloroflexota bacterium]
IVATVSRSLEAPAGAPSTAPDEVAALQLERGGLSLKPLSLLAVIVLWQALAVLNGSLHFYNPKLFPAPADIALAGWGLAEKGDLQRHVVVSVGRVLVGFAVAAPLAILLGVAVAKVRWCETILDPVVEALRPIPTLALLPIIILWFGIGETSKVFFIAYSCFFVIFTTTVLGVRNVDPILVRAARSLGLNRWRIYRHVILPSALPDVLVGLRLGLSVGFFVIVAAEFIAADTGLGYLINYSRTWFQVDNMMLGAIVIGALGISSNYLLVALEHRLFRWRNTGG